MAKGHISISILHHNSIMVQINDSSFVDMDAC